MQLRSLLSALVLSSLPWLGFACSSSDDGADTRAGAGRKDEAPGSSGATSGGVDAFSPQDGAAGAEAGPPIGDGGGGDAFVTDGGGALPAKIMGLYFFMYNTPRLATIQAQAPEYNVIYYAFALGSNNGGNVVFSVPSGGGDATFRSDLAAWKASGRIALLSIGGGSDTGLRLQNAAQGKQFVDSIGPIIDSYGFQGIDWDIEQSSAYTPSTIVDVSRQLKKKYGARFVVSIVPRPYEFRSGASPHPYRDIAAQLGSDLDLVGFQFYDYPESKNAAQQTSIIQGDIQDAIKSFPANKLLIGAEAPNAGLAWSPASVYRDAYKQMNAATGGLRGVFLWDSPNEQASGWTFAKTVGPSVLGP